MVPFHIVSAASQAAAADPRKPKETKLKMYGVEIPVGTPATVHNVTGIRVGISLMLGLVMSGALIAINWGGVGLFYRAPELSVHPGINAEWKSDNIAPLILAQESQENELYRERSQVAAMIGLKEGDDVADVGAGSGFLTEEMSKLVGARGRVTAVEINPALVDYIRNRADTRGLSNVRPRLGLETKLNINRSDNGNFDSIVLAGTYHHLEYPKSMLYSFHRLLRRRGQLIIIEPHRVPGQSPDAVLEHVRLGEEELIREVTAEGFELVDKPAAPFLKDHYVLRFKKD